MAQPQLNPNRQPALQPAPQPTPLPPQATAVPKSDSVQPVPTPTPAAPQPVPEAAVSSPLATPLPEATPDARQPLEIRLFRSYGHETLVHLIGRLVRPEEVPPVSADDSKWTNFWRNLKELSVHEVAGVKVRFELEGKSLVLTSNAEGMLLASTSAFGRLSPGLHELRASLVEGQEVDGEEYRAEPSQVQLVIHAQADTSPSLVTDIDDTIVQTQVTDKLQALQNFLLDNSYSSQPVAGTSELYQALEQNFDGKADGDVFYLSGSPLNFSDRVYGYLDTHHYPLGSVTLKKWGFENGDYSPLQQEGYKEDALRLLLKTYPHKPFYFFGDSGERDPEVYRQIAGEFPGRVKGIFINNVTGAQPDEARFEGEHLTRHSVDAAQILMQQGLLSAADVAKVYQALVAAQTQTTADD